MLALDFEHKRLVVLDPISKEKYRNDEGKDGSTSTLFVYLGREGEFILCIRFLLICHS